MVLIFIVLYHAKGRTEDYWGYFSESENAIANPYLQRANQKRIYFLIIYISLYSPQKSFKGKPIIDERQFHEKIAGLLPVTVVWKAFHRKMHCLRCHGNNCQ